MNGSTLFVTTNGPGEVTGWVRPFLRAVYDLQPDLKVTAIVLPCAYATGRESGALRDMFPKARVIEPASYGRFLLGRKVPGLERRPGSVLQYLGGDLFHAKLVARRLSLRPLTYKFTKRSYRGLFERFFALDEPNAAAMRALGAPPDKVRTIGNLVADSVVGALHESPPPAGTGDGVVIMPGSRSYELKYLMPFFLAVARDLVNLRPSTKITFVVSPFNTDDELSAAVGWSSDPGYHGIAGRYDPFARLIAVDGLTFAIDRSADYGTLARSKLVISIPGTKCMEAAVLGRALLVVVPLNRVDEIAMNGVAGYIQRVPLIGKPLKRWIAHRAEQRIPFFAQPNIDARNAVVPELRGILEPHEVAVQACSMLEDAHSLRVMGERLSGLYSRHVGSASRMAGEVLGFMERAADRVAV